MAIIALRAWYLQEYEPVGELEKRAHDLRLSKRGLLKTGLRADFLNELEEVKRSRWFERYIEGETVEFYIEGSGGYVVANIDLISQEIYFTKQDVLARLEPSIYFCSQVEYATSSSTLRETLQNVLEKLNKRSRYPLVLEESQHSASGPTRPSSTRTRKLRKSLLFIADVTAIAVVDSQLIPSPNTCIEIGYALESKRREHILLLQQSRPELEGELPFDLPSWQHLSFRDSSELARTLPGVLEDRLQRFSLFS
ncbi:MAG: hypothetical protein F6J93_33860 [Oscillatoria sp. SIO1A7]|nr:hypothetical protein [Oscillatoria sp. SIO1A7]